MALASLGNGGKRGQQNVFNKEMSSTSLPPSQEDWQKWVTAAYDSSSFLLRHPRIAISWNRTWPILTLLVCSSNRAHTTRSLTLFPCTFCGWEQGRGLRSLTCELLQDMMLCHQRPSPIGNGALHLHSTFPPPPQKPQESQTLGGDTGVMGRPVKKGCWGSKRQRCHRLVSLKSLVQGNQQGFSKQFGQFIKWSCPLYPNCKVTAS